MGLPDLVRCAEMRDIGRPRRYPRRAHGSISAILTSCPEAKALPASARLLLACCLDQGLMEGEQLRALAAAVDDWDAFLEQAAHHFVLPVVQARLGELLPPEPRARLEAAVLDVACHNLRIAGTLGQLHRDWLAPNGIRYAAVKGVTLAQRYYGAVGRRACRDLDILIDRPHFAPTVAHLCAAGYVLREPFELPDDPARHAAHIEAACDLNCEVALRSPGGVMIDLHRNLDLTGADFPPARLFGRAETVRIAGADIPVLSTADLFVYICYHHSRHQWSRLHWVADLGRIAAAPEFDRAATRRVAVSAGMEKLVLACLDMPRLLAGVVAGEVLEDVGLASLMAGECVTYLTPGALPPEHEHHARLSDRRYRWRHLFGTIATEWRQREGAVRRFRAATKSLRPSWQAYLDLPLPRGLRWLYTPWRFAAHLVRYLPLPSAPSGKRDDGGPPPRQQS
ncbi:nucleotidyltransferase family protein [Sphingomonas sp. ZT3P38]|uniref:nucleotidyltransferase domain-containing protein n=1 Tax=Parasphingomonas zepuensis TaxID=3096161 RepID=UPI002FC8FEA0